MKNAISALLLATSLGAQGAEFDLSSYKKYAATVEATSQLDSKAEVANLVKKFGLDILNVTWEDTGRNHNSSVGPNISDMTIQAHLINEKGDVKGVAMPVIRYPNFSDKTADISPEKIKLIVGNESNSGLKTISLKEYLANFRDYLTHPNDWNGTTQGLLAERDTHVLVSAQSTLLPIPKSGKAFFNPVLFNYQSSEKNPAVLAIVATREGTSATIIDNQRDSFERNWGQRLFFNQNGEKASFTGVRAAEFNSGIIPPSMQPRIDANNVKGQNVVLLIQVPLIHKETRRHFPYYMMAMERAATIDNAVIGHGPVEGPFIETDGLEIKRDERFPVRVTVQFYKASEGQNLSETDVQQMRASIDEVYKNADYVGSLVTEGLTGRPTEHTGPIWPTLPPVITPCDLVCY